MSDPRCKEAEQRRSWDENAEAWTRAIRSGAVTSRQGATNGAVLAAVHRCDPATVLDVGCGEGWLAHALAREGRQTVGIDASEALIAEASRGPGRFVRAGYDELASDDELVPGPFDVVVCNFSLLDERLASLLEALRARLTPERGRLVIQTLHPWTASGDGPYRDGWREERFDAFGTAFRAAMPWYGRTLASWWTLLEGCGLTVVRLEEPTVPGADRPSSLLLTARTTD